MFLSILIIHFFTHGLRSLHLTIDRADKIPVTCKTLCIFMKGFYEFPDLSLCIAGVRDGANKPGRARASRKESVIQGLNHKVKETMYER